MAVLSSCLTSASLFELVKITSSSPFFPSALFSGWRVSSTHQKKKTSSSAPTDSRGQVFTCSTKRTNERTNLHEALLSQIRLIINDQAFGYSPPSLSARDGIEDVFKSGVMGGEGHAGVPRFDDEVYGLGLDHRLHFAESAGHVPCEKDE